MSERNLDGSKYDWCRLESPGCENELEEYDLEEIVERKRKQRIWSRVHSPIYFCNQLRDITKRGHSLFLFFLNQNLNLMN